MTRRNFKHRHMSVDKHFPLRCGSTTISFSFFFTEEKQVHEESQVKKYIYFFKIIKVGLHPVPRDVANLALINVHRLPRLFFVMANFYGIEFDWFEFDWRVILQSKFVHSANCVLYAPAAIHLWTSRYTFDIITWKHIGFCRWTWKITLWKTKELCKLNVIHIPRCESNVKPSLR